jgi:hypothetical protein
MPIVNCYDCNYWSETTTTCRAALPTTEGFPIVKRSDWCAQGSRKPSDSDLENDSFGEMEYYESEARVIRESIASCAAAARRSQI